MAEQAKKAKALVKSADISDELQAEAIEVAQAALAKCSTEREMAAHVKQAFDEAHGSTWHCVVGKSFGSFVTHDSGFFTYFYLVRALFERCEIAAVGSWEESQRAPSLTALVESTPMQGEVAFLLFKTA